ncbi:MAG TPA: Zn-dependent hydrolase [Solirubrobacter sp.]|nr:Zn-dependent hydrolase [Solirubrobacter sp.]
MPDFDWERPLADLRELGELTGGPDGARRLAWTADWRAAREWLERKLATGTRGTVERDAAGNLWATLAGESDATVVVGSHIDAVPHGGWLDGCLGVLAALEILRAYEDTPPVTIKLVDWADEEGARFGRSLLGSSAAAGTLDPDAVRRLTDADGTALADALRENGVDLDAMGRAGLPRIDAYLELHIEQGPRLEAAGKPAAAVIGCFGAERHAVTFTGRASHAGSTPMHLRHDAFAAAARWALTVRESAVANEGVATVGRVAVAPGVPTIINGRCAVTLDQRALESHKLATMLDDAKRAAATIAEEEGVGVEWAPIYAIEPIAFDPRLVDLAAQAIEEVTGDAAPRLPSGALHDAAEIARRAPTVMLFAASTGGVSHSPAEDTPEDDLRAALRAFGRLFELTAANLNPS